MNIFNFTVEGEPFQFDSGFFDQEAFVVHSVPRDYTVSWKAENSPLLLIENILNQNPKNLLLIDKNVWDLYCAHSRINLNRVMFVRADEEFKTFHEGVEQTLSFLEKNNFGKGETLVVVGGGITQDIGAFVGAVYKRGIAWVFFPTTLLSMCDSCIGGKTGINYHKVKNQLALFSAPRQVLLCAKFLTTLHHREIQSGLGEILKLFITGGPEILKLFHNLVEPGGKIKDTNNWKKLIFGALGVKKLIVEKDEFELNLRKSLNYGHTLGHAIEVLTNYAIPHGQAVTMGLLCVNEMSRRRGLLSQQSCDEIRLLANHLFQTAPVTGNIIQELPALLLKDKKSIGNAVQFVFIQAIGNTLFKKLEVTNLLVEEIADILKKECYAN